MSRTSTLPLVAFAGFCVTSFFPTNVGAVGGAAAPSPTVVRFNVGEAPPQSLYVTEVTNDARPTSLAEHAIGEIRRWETLEANWDGEGGSPAIQSSANECVSFICSLATDIATPAPMLQASGRIGLLWRAPALYAHLEFIGDGRVAFYIEKNDKIHKGVVDLGDHAVPALLQTLLSSA